MDCKTRTPSIRRVRIMVHQTTEPGMELSIPIPEPFPGVMKHLGRKGSDGRFGDAGARSEGSSRGFNLCVPGKKKSVFPDMESL